MSFRIAACIVPALLLSACSQAQLDSAVGTITAATSDFTAVAKRIDAGAGIATGDLPLACRITADIGAAADTLASSGLVGESRRPTLRKAAAAASALAASDLCQNPAGNPVSTSLQIIRAVAAVRAAARSSGDLSAASVTATIAQ